MIWRLLGRSATGLETDLAEGFNDIGGVKTIQEDLAMNWYSQQKVATKALQSV